MPLIGLGAGVVAIVLLAFILAAATGAILLGKAVPDVPLIGGAIRGAMTRTAQALSAWAERLFDDGMYAAGWVFLGVGLSVWWVASATVNALSHSITVARGAYVYASQAATGAIHVAEGLYNRAVSFAQGVATDAIHVAENLYNAAIGHTNGLYNDAIAHADGVGQAVLHDAQALYNQSVAYANGVGQEVLHDAESLYNQAVAGTASTAATLLRDLQAEADSAAAEVRAAIAAADATAASLAHSAVANASSVLDRAAADVLNPTLDALFPALAVIAPALPTEIERALGLSGVVSEGDIAGVIGALGVLAPAIAGVATEVAECTVPMCRNLGGLSSLFGDLTDAALLGALLAFLAEAAHDPAQAAGDAEGALGAVVGDVAGAFRSLGGI